jgi:hypothetical protein
MLLLATVPSLVRGVLLQDGSHVVDLVEDLDSTLYVFRPRAVDHQVEDVEVTGFSGDISPSRALYEVRIIWASDLPSTPCPGLVLFRHEALLPFRPAPPSVQAITHFM